MNRDPIPTILAGVLLISVIATAGLCYWYLQVSRQLQYSQAQAIRINRNRAVIQSFAAEAMEYSKRNPNILPILNSVGIRPRGEQGTTNTLPRR